MPGNAKCICPQCDEEVVCGTQFCWRHPSNPPRVGEYTAQDGQLLWASDDACRGRASHCLAVLVNAQQVCLRRVDADVSRPPARLLVEYVEWPVLPQATSRTALVPMDALYQRIADGWESVDATPGE